MFVEREEDGIHLQDLPVWVVDTLLSLPEWIESDNPAVRKRLLPRAYEDAAQDKEWRDALGSSLEHLFASRTEIVRADLQKMEVSVPPQELTGNGEEDEIVFATQTLFSVFVPAAHVSAWVSTLQAGSHALFILEGLTEEDLNHDVGSTSDPDKQVSMMRLSVLQEILVSMIDG